MGLQLSFSTTSYHYSIWTGQYTNVG